MSNPKRRLRETRSGDPVRNITHDVGVSDRSVPGRNRLPTDLFVLGTRATSSSLSRRTHHPYCSRFWVSTLWCTVLGPTQPLPFNSSEGVTNYSYRDRYGAHPPHLSPLLYSLGVLRWTRQGTLMILFTFHPVPSEGPPPLSPVSTRRVRDSFTSSRLRPWPRLSLPRASLTPGHDRLVQWSFSPVPVVEVSESWFAAT